MSSDVRVINGDISLLNGDVVLLSGTDKLIQDILKICLTPVGANIYQPFYGSFLNQTVIGSHFESDMIVNIAENQLQNALENLKRLQQLQSTNILQQVTPDEQIAGIKEVRVTRNPSDPRGFDVSIVVLTKTFRPATITFTTTPSQ